MISLALGSWLGFQHQPWFPSCWLGIKSNWRLLAAAKSCRCCTLKIILPGNSEAIPIKSHQYDCLNMNKDNNILANVGKGKLKRPQTYTENYRNIDSQRKSSLGKITPTAYPMLNIQPWKHIQNTTINEKRKKPWIWNRARNGCMGKFGERKRKLEMM